MSQQKRTIFVTSALPYANGPIHIGHLVEYIQTDIWVRFQKLRGHDCVYVCADDAHGTPIMLRAEQEGITPEALIERISAEHQRDFSGFDIGFDNYYSTHSDENRAIASEIYQRLAAGGYIERRTIKQLYDPDKAMFLPDRFIRGTCPRCATPDQYGDSCENCGATYAPEDLINPVSALSGTTPVERESEHLFFRLGEFEALLREWIDTTPLHPGVTAKLAEWFETGLRDWDISRDAPYFGFEIPDAPGKYFYVWLDAPIGYLASLADLCARTGRSYEAYTAPGSDAEMVHFIGKDIVYFHTLFWPAMLAGADLRLPTNVCVHGFLTVDGQKMSKSRGTFIEASTYLEHLDPAWLRYYFAAKLSGGIEDIDLNLDDFQNRVNADLVGKVVNIASRCAGFISKRCGGVLSERVAEPDLLDAFAAEEPAIAEAYENRDYARAMRAIMALADRANQYIDHHKPWVLAKQEGQDEALHDVCSMGLHMFRALAIYLAPVLPDMTARAARFLGEESFAWDDLQTVRTGAAINKFEPLMTRVDAKAVAAMVEASRQEQAPAPAPAP
ncbi:MAG: methionine--tRNA ligase, partial [Gammaproteobacteria bacterium]|nr:methionine--tRNA ligase [Gammaproteobacteria bacterium]